MKLMMKERCEYEIIEELDVLLKQMNIQANVGSNTVSTHINLLLEYSMYQNKK